MAKAVYEDDPSDEDQIAPVKRSNKPVYEDDAAESGMPAYQGRTANTLAGIQNEYGNAPAAPAQDLGNEGRRTSMAIAPAAKKPVAKQKPNFDPALRSSESVGNSQLATLNKQLQKAPENAGRMAAQQRLATKAANTAADQAIIDRMAKRTRPYMTDEARNNMKRGGAVKKMASGGKVSSASSRGDGIAQRGKTRGKMC